MAKHLIDTARIKVKAGDGGDGLSSMRRERFLPKGGPDGGDGGSGGSVYIVGDHNMATLMDFRSKPNYEAEKGARGGKKKQTGVSGEDLIIHVPVGTLVYLLQEDKKILIGDIVGSDDEIENVLVARGGKGGRGNTRFKSSTNQAPDRFTPGTPGEEVEIELEIKLVADVGLVGFPNAGKSTLINRLTNANAKTASYPFTTLIPNLGTMELKTGETIILADIPGLIEGASEGKGLGDDFLRHIERTRILVHMIDPLYAGEADVVDISEMEDLVTNSIQSYKAIRNELESYGAGLEDKQEIVLINKNDVTEVYEAFDNIAAAFKKENIEVIGVSAVSGLGIDELEKKLIEVLEEAPPRHIFEISEQPVKIYTLNNIPNRRMIQG